jgi:hypothetical protein
MIRFAPLITPYILNPQVKSQARGARATEEYSMQFRTRNVILGLLGTGSLVLTIAILANGSKLQAQFRQFHWDAAKPPAFVDALLAADKMAPMSVAALDGNVGSAPAAKKLVANTSKFPGLKIKAANGDRIKANTPKKAGATKKNLFPKFRAVKTERGMKLKAGDGTKFKTQAGKKASVDGKSKYAVKKAPAKSDKWVLSKKNARANKNAKKVFPGSKLSKLQKSIKQAKRSGNGDMKKSFPGSLNKKPALFTKNVRFDQGRAQKVRVTKTALQ